MRFAMGLVDILAVINDGFSRLIPFKYGYAARVRESLIYSLYTE